VNRPTIPRRPGCRVRRLAFLVLLAALFLPGCGKKGPPLPPLVKTPTRPDAFVARRLGSTVYIQFRIPTVNSDATSPASIERVEVYGFTGAPNGNEDIFKNGMLVASVPVRKPPESEEDQSAKPKKGEAGKPTRKPENEPPPPPRPPPSMENGFDQGDTIVVTEPLGPAQFAEVVPKTKEKKKPPVVEPLEKEGPRPAVHAVLPPLPSRVYVAVGVNRKGQKGAVSGRQVVLLTAPASPPSTPDVTYDEHAFTISWQAPADVFPPAGGGTGSDVLRSTPFGTRAVSGAYNVYEVPAPMAAPEGVKPPAPPAAGGQMPTPVNDKPLGTTSYADKRMEFGKRRCYAVRAVSVFGPFSIESEASPSRCVTPADTFAPAAPTSLKAVGSEGAISLIWEANKEADLAGYVVLRATLPGGEFVPVTPEPVKETTFNDTTVKSGVRYAYVVVAVDQSKNRSARSNQVEESAR
jgi:hypothetical protein